MLARDFWRTGRWHTASSTFQITSGPSVVSLGETGFVVRWTMSEVCSGQVLYGTSAGALTSSTTYQDISGGYSTHQQGISGLDPATPYYFQTTSTSASGQTVTSTVQMVTTAGDIRPPVPYGPRYDEYGAGASGNFPTFPSGAGVVVAPTSILSASDVGAALGTWITQQANNATMVLDSSGGGTAYGAGTEYVINDVVSINPGSGVLRTGQTLWMYNTRIRSTNRSGTGIRGTSKGANIIWQQSGGWQDFTMLGGTLMGANDLAGTYACRSLGTEMGHGFMPANYNNLIMRDVYIRNVMGDGVNLRQSNVQTGVYATGFTHPQDFEMGYCLVDGTGRQGVVPNQCDGFWLHHSHVLNTALSSIDSEDNIENPSGYRFLRGGLVEDNIFEKWTWHLVNRTPWTTYNYHTWGIQFTTDDPEVDVVDDWVYQRNIFRFGHAGWGNPDAEFAVLGQIVNGGAGCGNIHVMACPPFWHDATRTQSKTAFSFIDNTFELQPNQRNGYALGFREVAGLVITGNDMHGLNVRAIDCSSVTFSGNGTSSLVTT